jgi:cellulose synthase/poly-beta-1,6-N-acetylglucosamine synthase-like glycosyltransferase
MWRTRAIAESGGWQHDTLTEDLDLSYRAQMAAGKFVYRETSSRPPSSRRSQRFPRAAVPLGEGNRPEPRAS